MNACSRAWVLLIAVLAFVSVGCTEPDAPAAKEWPAATQDIAAFGELVLPPDVEVLAASRTDEPIKNYLLTLRVTPAQLDELLAKSNFTDPRKPNQYASGHPILTGPPLSSATDLRYAQDSVDTEHGLVHREVIEDHQSPDEIYVHLTLFQIR